MLHDETPSSQVQAVVIGFFVALDGFDDDRALACLSEDVMWIRGAGTLKGHAAVRNTLAARPRDRRTRHLVSNLVIHIDGSDTATARCDVLVFQGRIDGNGSPAVVTGPDSIITTEDRLVRVAGTWRIRSKRPVVVFRVAAPGAAAAGG